MLCRDCRQLVSRAAIWDETRKHMEKLYKKGDLISATTIAINNFEGIENYKYSSEFMNYLRDAFMTDIDIAEYYMEIYGTGDTLSVDDATARDKHLTIVYKLKDFLFGNFSPGYHMKLQYLNNNDKEDSSKRIDYLKQVKHGYDVYRRNIDMKLRHENELNTLKKLQTAELRVFDSCSHDQQSRNTLKIRQTRTLDKLKNTHFDEVAELDKERSLLNGARSGWY